MWRQPWNATITQHSLPETPKEEGMNRHWQNKRHIWPSRHTTSKWRRINVDATWSRRINVDTTSLLRCVPIGEPLDWRLHSFLHFLSFFITSCSCICLFNPFHCFTTETTLSFPLRDITYQIIISCTRLYNFEKKRENDRKYKSGYRLMTHRRT